MILNMEEFKPSPEQNILPIDPQPNTVPEVKKSHKFLYVGIGVLIIAIVAGFFFWNKNQKISQPLNENDQTLAGIDADNDGVRDDVQAYIELNYKDSVNTQAALSQYAKAVQTYINGTATIPSEVLAVRCSVYVFGVKEARQISQSLLDVILNTPDRYKAYLNSNDRLANVPFPKDSESNPKLACDFDPDNLDATAGWKTYTNPQYGFEAKIPTDWTVTKEYSGSDSQPTIRVLFSSPETLKFYESSKKCSECDGGPYEYDFSFSSSPGTKDKTLGQVKIGNYIWNKYYEYDFDGASHYELSQNNKTYHFRSANYGEKNDAILEKFLLQFKVITPSQPSVWQSYQNDKYGFEFKYPGTWDSVTGGDEGISFSTPGCIYCDEGMQMSVNVFSSFNELKKFYYYVDSTDLKSFIQHYFWPTSSVNNKNDISWTCGALEGPGNQSSCIAENNKGEIILLYFDTVDSFIDEFLSTFKFTK